MLLERDNELGILDELLTGLDASGGRVVLIRGEAGIGKSSLVAELMSRHRPDTHILFGACDDLLTPQPLGAVWDVARDEPDLLAALADIDQRRVHDVMLELMSRALRPTLLIIEDTQWADEATLDVITFLGRRIARANGVLVLTYRDGEVDADHPLRQVIGQLPPQRIVRIQVGHLSADAVATMIGDRDFDAGEVLALTDGNPLFVSEVLSAGMGGVPMSISDVVLARASRTSLRARELLELLSVLPGETDIAVVEEILGSRDAELAECQRLGLVRTDDRTVGFTHELQRRAVESSLEPQRRRDLNRTALRALASNGDPALLAHHAREAQDIDAIMEYAPVAARAAVSSGSTREAVKHFRLLEPYLERLDDTAAASILMDWARQEYFLDGDATLGLIETCVDVRRTIGDDAMLAAALTFLSRVEMHLMHTEDALAHALEAVDLLEPEGPGPQLMDSLSALAYVEWLYHEDVPAAREIVNRAIDMADGIDDERPLIMALRTKGSMEHSVGIPGAMELLEASRAIAERVGDRYQEAAALVVMAGMAADVRDVAIAADLARRAVETAIRYEMRNLEAEAKATLAEILLWRGDWAGAENAAFDALDSKAGAAAIAWRVLGTIQVRKGRSEARAALDRMWATADTSEQLTIIDPAATILAEYQWLTGDHDVAWSRRLDEVLAFGISVGPPWPSGAFAFWMWKLGRFDPVHPIAEFYAWIMSGEPRRAADFWRRRSIPYEEALAMMHGDTEDRIDAVRILEQLGADATAAHVRQGLADDGVRVPRGRSRTTLDHAAGLTARQAEVLDLVAERLTNAEIADRLFISHRTVENHVAAILMKLDVPTREDAVAAALDRGILASG